MNYNILTIGWCLAWMAGLFAVGFVVAQHLSSLAGASLWVIGTAVCAFLGKIFVPTLRAPGETKETWVAKSREVLLTALVICGVALLLLIHANLVGVPRTVIAFGPGLLSVLIAALKGFKPIRWFIALGVIGLIVVLCLPSVRGKELEPSLMRQREDRANSVGRGLAWVGIVVNLLVLGYVMMNGM